MTFCGDTSSCQGLVESISVQRGSVIKYFNQRFYFMFYRRAHEWRREQIQSLWSFDYNAVVRWVFTQSTQLSVFFTRCSSTHDSRRRILRAEKMDFKPRLEDGKIYIEVWIFWHHDKKFSAVFFIRSKIPRIERRCYKPPCSYLVTVFLINGREHTSDVFRYYIVYTALINVQ